MKNHKAFFAVLLIVGLIGMVRGLDFNDNDNFLHVNVNNHGDEDIDDLTIRVLIYDLGVVLQTSNFDLDDKDTTGKAIFWDVPSDVKPGDYWARITVSNDDVREVEHRLITII